MSQIRNLVPLDRCRHARAAHLLGLPSGPSVKHVTEPHDVSPLRLHKTDVCDKHRRRILQRLYNHNLFIVGSVRIFQPTMFHR